MFARGARYARAQAARRLLVPPQAVLVRRDLPARLCGLIVRSIAIVGLVLAIAGCNSQFEAVTGEYVFAEEVLGFSGGSKLQVSDEADSTNNARVAMIEVSSEMVEAAQFAQLTLVVGPVELEALEPNAKQSRAAHAKNPSVTIGFAHGRDDDDDDDGEHDDGDDDGDDDDRDPCQSSAKVGPFEVSDNGEFFFPLSDEVRAVIRRGRFALCANAEGGFPRGVHVHGFMFVAGSDRPNEDWVTVCHHPEGREAFTLLLPPTAIGAHMAHGDTLGPCEFIGSCAQNDEDGDGVNDCTDECPLTAFELLVDNSGCPIVVLEASAGPDMNATSGELVTLHGAAHVVQGQVDPASFVWNWAQTAGPAANMQQDGPDLTVDTTGVDGELTFTLDVSAAGGEASASDQANVVVVVPVVLEADAGADVDAVGGDVVTLLGSAQILQGVASSDEFVWLWEQASGPNVSFAQNGAELTLDTTGLAGELVFRLTVSIPGAEASASDEVVVAVTRPLPLRLAAGKWHNAYLDGYGHLQLWGWERYGQTGDGSLVDDLLDADAANRHTVVVTSEGQAFAFGEDAIGNSASPNLVPGAADIVQVAAMDQGAFMLTAAGQVLGVNGGVATCALAGATSRDSSGALMAVPVPGLPLGVVEITAGAAHGVAVDSNGAAWIWGSRFGCTPRVVLDHVVTAAAGDTDLALFARDDGTAWGIGFNLHGQLGTGNTTSNYNVPRQVVGLTNVVAVAAGDRHSMFLKDDGTLWTAGWNRYCQLGLEDEIAPAVHQFGFTVLLPVQVGLQDVVAVAGGETHTIAVTGDGTVWGWGQNLVGQLTDGTNTTLPGEVCMPVALSLP